MGMKNGMRPSAFITPIFVLTTGAFVSLTEFKTVTEWGVKTSPGRWGLEGHFACERCLRAHPQFLMSDPPLEGR